MMKRSELLKKCRKCFNGLIFLFWGALDNIPEGWQVCDGTNGTPNLQDRFIIGAGGKWPVGFKYGTLTHNHFFYTGDHSHKLLSGAGILSGTTRPPIFESAIITGYTDYASPPPPYKALYFITRKSQE
jgi:hypothetical protein